MCFTIVSGASKSRPVSWKLQRLGLVSDKILNVWVSGLVSVSAQKVSCTSLNNIKNIAIHTCRPKAKLVKILYMVPIRLLRNCVQWCI